MILGILLAITALFATGFFAVLWLVGKSAVTQEASNVLPDATRRLIGRAKNRLPEDARKRYEEEWPAGFEEAIEKRPIWAFREAVSLHHGARRIARELEPTPVPAGRGRLRIGFAANSAVSRASGLVARVREATSRASRFVEQIAHGFRDAMYRVYGPRAAEQIITLLGQRLPTLIRLVLAGSCVLLVHNVFGFL